MKLSAVYKELWLDAEKNVIEMCYRQPDTLTEGWRDWQRNGKTDKGMERLTEGWRVSPPSFGITMMYKSIRQTQTHIYLEHIKK